ncbi:MAG TPA: sugar phosphorylase [Candidatus Limnocylindrales bacterium]|nr:sugar phosphorylase [Candidatus Limnocylindrales bacterium]
MTTRPLRAPNEVRQTLKVRLHSLYDDAAAEAAYESLMALVENRPRREDAYALSERDALLIAYGDHVRRPGEAPLATLQRLLADLSVPANSLHLLPFYPYSSDDGFSVIDYEQVDPALGNWDDIHRLGHDYRLMFDAVFNHISAHSAWFQAFTRGVKPYDEYFIVADPATDLSLVTRPRALPLLTPVQTPSGVQHVWTTFSADQIDLNFANPAVLVDVVRILLEYVEHGAALIRLDAIAFLWKAIGTTCIHLPETHTVNKILRDMLDLTAPSVLMITETNVPHDENISYFGDGVDEAQLVYQFPLPPLIAHSLLSGSAHRLIDWAATIAPVSESTTFFNFTASHDGVGMRPATGLLDKDEAAALVNMAMTHGGQVSYKTNSDGSHSPYELNITYFDLITAPEVTEHEPDVAIKRFLVSQAIMLAMIGVPGIYFSSLFGSHNDYRGVEHSGRARSINRHKYDDAHLRAALADPASLPARVLAGYRHLLAARTNEPAFHPLGSQRVVAADDRVVALMRTAPDESARVLALHNISGAPVPLSIPAEEVTSWHDLLSGRSYSANENGTLSIELEPYQIAWLKAVER